ncbi:MAG: hypothetical protein ABIK07_04555 [Planctomycetota bacterium]
MTDSVLKPLTILCFFIVLQGCGTGNDGPVTAPVKGTVMIDGTLVPKGDIIFEPADGQGPAAAGVIKEGAFEFTSPVGMKKVMIFASRKSGKKGRDFGEDIMESYIPEKYNTDSELKENVITGAGNEFQFDLKSK